MPELRSFQKILVANRSEIAIRVFRACSELGIRTVGIYSMEDRGALHRYKADETYLLPNTRDPLQAYLDIPAIVEIARLHGADAIHPGYGFLSENAEFARACEQAGIVFIGPPPPVLEQMGDKTEARALAQKEGLPVVPGTAAALSSADEAVAWAEEAGYPVILKAAMGGGGRGMRVANDERELRERFTEASSEALAAFGSGAIFLERYLKRPRHIEVQVLADSRGSVVHLYERDCSIQRRHQKVIELAPSPNLKPELRESLCAAAVKLARAAGYCNAGTVEFLLDEEDAWYFIEMNPRIQVEHTVTEMVTGIDIVKAQIRVAEGHPLDSPQINLPSQSAVGLRGYAIQCRITSEDPENNFIPDYGRITHYRSAAGFGIRLDGGTAFSGALITPFYDSLLVKLTAWSLDFGDCCNRLERALAEFRVRGVKTNIHFLQNVVRHPTFRAGECTVRFIEETPELFQFVERGDRASRLLEFIADISVNGNPTVLPGFPRPRARAAVLPGETAPPSPYPAARDRLRELGADRFCDWVLNEKRLLITDTTLRDAHQSLLATRVRTDDMQRIVPSIQRDFPHLFSLEMWGGATFDVALRFLHEDPWERLALLRKQAPGILFQMLLRGSNAVGYTNYPDNVVRRFVQAAASGGIDLFRIFDSLNYVPGMLPAIEAVRETGALAEAAICYTSDLFDTSRPRYGLEYYLRMARELKSAGAHIIGIKDMAGLCRPYAARTLVRALKEEIGLPVHFHTHDTAGGQVASYLFAAEAGVDIVDCAISSMSGLTSQPCLEAVVAALERQERDTGLDLQALIRHAAYWLAVREQYAPFECDLRSGTGDVYIHEIPGGQYSNLRPQAEAMGLGDRLPELKQMYAVVNRMLGDIIKVTPSSKVVGDLALFMMTNNLTPEDLLRRGEELQFPDPVIGLFAGEIGYPEGGWPPDLQRVVLKGRKPVEGNLASHLPPVNWDEVKQEVARLIGREPSECDILSYLMYPQVFQDYERHRRKYGDVSPVPTPVFFFGMQPGDETEIQIDEGKILFIKLLTLTTPDETGMVTVFYELNGHPREVRVADRSAVPQVRSRLKADPDNLHHVGANMPGAIIEVAVAPGAEVGRDDPLVAMEAMKVRMSINSPRAGRVREVLVAPGDRVDTGDLLVVFE